MLHMQIRRQQAKASDRSGEYAMDASVGRCNQRVKDGMETLELRELERKMQEEEQFRRTLINPHMITQASQNIKKLNASLRHHVLSSEYCEDVDPSRSKYIDLQEGVAYDTQIIGDGEDPLQAYNAGATSPSNSMESHRSEKLGSLI